MKPNAGKKRGRNPRLYETQRRGLLAKAHIAKKDLGLRDDEYEACILRIAPGCFSAGSLTVPQLEDLVDYFRQIGWRPAPKRKPKTAAQAEALRERAVEIASRLTNGKNRLAGLVKVYCGVSHLKFCHNIAKLEKLLRVLAAIEEQDIEKGARP